MSAVQSALSKKRSQTLDVLRGVAILIVVIAHAMQYAVLPGEESLLWMRFIRPFQMPLLFLISGWALAFSFPPRSNSVFLRKKIERLFVPYVVWMLVMYAISVLSGSGDFSIAGLWHEFVESDFWFLRALFLNYAVVWIGLLVWSKWFKEKKWGPMVVVIMGLVLVLLLRKIDLLRPTANGWFYQWFLTGYLAHVFVNKYRDRVALWMAKHGVRVAMVSAVILVALVVSVYFCNLSQNLVAYLSIPCICLLVVICVDRIPAFFSRLLAHWGVISLSIYAIHFCLFISVSARHVGLVEDWPFAARVLLFSIAWLLGCELLNWLFMKTGITRVLLLGEAKK